jgi:predicted Zn-dependent protease
MTLFGNNYDGSPRIGFHLSWIIGAMIILFGVLRYFAHTQVNPVTGVTQHISMTPNQEMSLGLGAAPRMAAQMGGEANPASDPGAREVAKIGQQLATRSDAARSPYASNFHYHLLNDPQTVNAFALPGGQVFITRALLDRLNNEAQLAGVLGHETGHVIWRHSAQQMEKGQLGQTIATGVAVGASSDRNGYAEAAAAQMANQMLQLRYSREDESQADEYGMRYMSQAGYDPHEMLGVMDVLKKLEAETPGGQPEMLRTHPLATTRIQRVRDLLQQNDYSDQGRIHFTTGATLQHGLPAGGGTGDWGAGTPRQKGKDDW